MCGINKKCSCGCSVKKKVNEASYEKKITMFVTDPENTISELLNSIKNIGSQGHGFDIIVDPELKSENDEAGIKTEFYWDGDGTDRIKEIQIEDVNDSAVSSETGYDYEQNYLTPGLNEAKKSLIDKDKKEILDLFVKHYKLNKKLSSMTNGKFMSFNKEETDLNRKVQDLKNKAWDLARRKNLDSNEIIAIDKEAKLKAEGKKKMTESEEADYYEGFANDLRNNGQKHGADIMDAKAKASQNNKQKDGEIITEASKVNLKLTSNAKRELIKKAKTALDAIYSIYDICERLDINNPKFIDWIDEAFEGVNESLTMLVVQNSIEPVYKK